MRTLLIAGGSGGHLMPALTLAEHLRGMGPCLMLSTARPVDRTLAAASSLTSWNTVNLKKFTSFWKWFSPLYSAGQLVAVGEVWSVMRRMRPDVVVGFGGYLSAVGLAAARLQGVPTVVHEQNFMPGRANRWLAAFADAVAVSFPGTREFLPRQAVVEVTGNPVRSHLNKIPFEQARASFGFDRERPVLLVMGGSQGSRTINGWTTAIWEDQPPAMRRRVQVLHLAGSTEASRVEEAYRRLGVEARVFPFLHEMDQAYAAATLAVSRAGATGIAEMVALELPAVLVPYPFAGAHQRANARWMESTGGARVVEEAGGSAKILWDEMEPLLWDPERLQRMRAALRICANGSAVERLGSLVRRVAR